MTIKFYKAKSIPYGCFSNFSRHGFTCDDGKYWRTSEHYFQAKKYEGTEYEKMVRNAETPGDAARLGRRRDFPLRKDWETVKDDIMRDAVWYKFSQNPDIAEVLLLTRDEDLIEDTKKDYYWGCGKDGSGENMLGKILMEVRDILREE